MSGSLYAGVIQGAANIYGVPENLLTDLLSQESSFQNLPQSGGSNGPAGIAQFIPSTAQLYGVNTSDTTSSINGAAAYLADLYAKSGSWLSAVTSYGTLPSSYQNMVPGQQTLYNTASALDAAASGGGSPNDIGGISSGTGSSAATAAAGLNAASAAGGYAFSGVNGSTSSGSSGSSWYSQLMAWLTGPLKNGAYRGAFGLIAVVFIVFGLAALIMRSPKAQNIVVNAGKSLRSSPGMALEE